VQVGRFALHTAVEGMQFWFLISQIISVSTQSSHHIRSTNKSRVKNFAFHHSWRFTGGPSHIIL